MGRPRGRPNNPKPAGWTPPQKKANSNAVQLLARCMRGSVNTDAVPNNAVVEDSVEGSRPPPVQANLNEATTSNKVNVPAGSKDWNEQLLALGYGQLNCQIPNNAVQALLCCFGEANIHDYIIKKELALSDSKLSVVAYLGFKGWLAVLARYMKHPLDVLTDIARQYASMYEYLCSRTEKEDFTNLMGEGVIRYMEMTNNVDSNNKKRRRNNIPTPPPKKQNFGNSIFGAARAGINPSPNRAMKPDTSDPKQGNKDAERLNMFNSYFFPALTNDVVESLGKQFDHVLWKCKNYGVLAPISAQSFVYLADLKDEQIAGIKQVTENGECILEKCLVDLPFTTQIFEKTCKCPWGIYANQKNHMADPKIQRDDIFAMKIWRSFCPYLKCGCDKKYYKGDERLKCRDNITWFDQAIWFLLNHLEVLYPNTPKNEAFLSLVSLISTSLQHVALAQVGFLHFRETLINIACDYAFERNSKAVIEKFGNTEMVRLALDMIMAPPKEDNDGNGSSSMTIISRGSSFGTSPSSMADYYPPRIVRSTETNAKVSSGSAVPTCHIGESSVSKPQSPRRIEHNVEPTTLDLD